MRTSRIDYDIAYGAFLFCGIVSLSIGFMTFFPMGARFSGPFGFLVFIPLFLGSMAALLLGLIYTVKLYHHWPLVLLALLTLLFVAEVVTEFGSVLFYNLAPLIYGVSACGFSFAWFLIMRKRIEPD